MARIDNNAKLNAFLSNDDNFVAVGFNDPRAVAHRAKVAAAGKRAMVAQAKVAKANAAHASTFTIGQIVRHKNRPFDRAGEVQGPITAMDDRTITIQRANGSSQTFLAIALVAA